MKSILFAAMLAALSVGASAQTGNADGKAVANTRPSLPIGAPIPLANVELKATTGQSISLNKAKGAKGLLVMFSCNTCPYVVKSQGRTLEAIKTAKETGVGFIILNSNEAQRGDADSYSAMAEYAKSQGYDVPYAVDNDSKLANAFGATRTSEVYLFNKEGRLIYKGAMEDNPSDPASSKQLFLTAALKNLDAGGPISPAETKSIGCSIKRKG